VDEARLLEKLRAIDATETAPTAKLGTGAYEEE
jgi:hypothetical protein